MFDHCFVGGVEEKHGSPKSKQQVHESRIYNPG
jgi:hypothetical protein